jgi:hypothetical protein
MVPPVIITALHSALVQHQTVFPVLEHHTSPHQVEGIFPDYVSQGAHDAVLFMPSDPMQEEVGVSCWRELIACLSSDTPSITSFTPDEKGFIIDTGASIANTPDSSDFPQGF